MTTFLSLGAVLFIGMIAIFVGVVVILKKRGFFSKARDDAAQVLNDAAKEAVSKVIK